MSKKGTILLDERLGDQVIEQQVLSPEATKLLVAMSKRTLVFDLVKKQGATKLATHDQRWPWINHPSQPDHVLHFEECSIQIFSWTDLEPVISIIKLEGHEGYHIDYEHYALVH